MVINVKKLINQLKLRYSYSIILVRQLVKTDFKLRYQGSVLGYVWSLLRPLALFVILYLVFVRFLGIGEGTPHFPVYLLMGIVLWNFFTETTTGSIQSIVNKGDLIRKINFPKYIIPISGSLSALINLFINLLVVVFFMILSDVPFRGSLVYMPVIILQLYVLALSMSFFLSSLYVKYRDIGFIWEVIMQAAFYATPILYPLSRLSVSAAKILLLNPAAQIIQDARAVSVTSQTITIKDLYGSGVYRVIPLGITLLIAVVSVLYFRKNSKKFAEMV